MSDRLSPQREAEIRERLAEARRVAAEADWPLGEYRVVKQQQTDAGVLLAELAAVRAERDQARERARDALNRELVDGREVCADCDKPVADGPCTVHSPDAVFQRQAQEAAQLRRERDAARNRVADATEYGIRIDGKVLLSGSTKDRSDQKARLERYLDTWPEAVLVQRSVFHGEWTEASR